VAESRAAPGLQCARSAAWMNNIWRSFEVLAPGAACWSKLHDWKSHDKVKSRYPLQRLQPQWSFQGRCPFKVVALTRLLCFSFSERAANRPDFSVSCRRRVVTREERMGDVNCSIMWGWIRRSGAIPHASVNLFRGLAWRGEGRGWVPRSLKLITAARKPSRPRVLFYANVGQPSRRGHDGRTNSSD
jgi:hypothetical protein